MKGALKCQQCTVGMIHVWSDSIQLWVCEDCSYAADLMQIVDAYAR